MRRNLIDGKMAQLIGSLPEDARMVVWSWVNDPCWDLSTTPGLVPHWPTLANIERACKETWAEQRAAELEVKAAEMGIPGNVTLAAYIERLERNIEELSLALERIDFSR